MLTFCVEYHHHQHKINGSREWGKKVNWIFCASPRVSLLSVINICFWRFAILRVKTKTQTQQKPKSPPTQQIPHIFFPYLYVSVSMEGVPPKSIVINKILKIHQFSLTSLLLKQQKKISNQRQTQAKWEKSKKQCERGWKRWKIIQ